MDNKRCKILNLWPCRNYGALLTCFGVQCLLEKLGYQPQVINYFPTDFFRTHYQNSFSQKFASEYLHLTPPVRFFSEFNALNQDCDIFIAGSDQIWNNEIIKTHHVNVSEWIFLLDFAQSSSRKVSYAASFGTEKFPDSDYLKTFYDYFLHRFDAISVRENEGIDILNDVFDLPGKQVIDGAFHIPAAILEKMTAQFPKKEKYIGFYSLPGFKFSSEHEKFLNNLSQTLDMPVKRMILNEKTSVDEWLAFIKNADLMVATSYHAVVFSIIFKRPLLQITHPLTQSRFDSLYDMLAMPDLTVEVGPIDKAKIKTAFSIDYDRAEKLAAAQVAEAEAWMAEALTKPMEKTDTGCTDHMNFLYQTRIYRLQEQIRQNYHEANKRKIYFKYYRYKLLSKILPGKKGKKYQAKFDALTPIINKYFRKKK